MDTVNCRGTIQTDRQVIYMHAAHARAKWK